MEIRWTRRAAAPCPLKLLKLLRPTQQSAWPPHEIICTIKDFSKFKGHICTHFKWNENQEAWISPPWKRLFSVAIQLELDLFGLSLSLPAQTIDVLHSINKWTFFFSIEKGKFLLNNKRPRWRLYMCSICMGQRLVKLVLELFKYFQEALFWSFLIFFIEAFYRLYFLQKLIDFLRSENIHLRRGLNDELYVTENASD